MPRITRIFAALLTALPLTAYAGTELSYQYNGKEYAGKELPAAVRTQLYELEIKINEQRQQIVDQHILDAYLREQAKEKGKTPEEFAAQLLTVAEPDEKALRKFYDENWERIQKPYDEVKGELVGLVWNQMQQDKVKEVLKQVATDKGYKVNLPQPESPTFDINVSSFPMKGNATAAVTVVEFADFQCPHCKEAAGIVKKLVESHGQKVRFVYRHMPINPSGISRKVAEAADCAGQQGKFWEYHDLAFEQQKKLDDKSPLKLATELKLDEVKFKTCLEDPKTAEALKTAEEEARFLGVTGTPNFFVDGKPFQPHVEMEKELVVAIDTALAAKTGSSTSSTAPVAAPTTPAAPAAN